MLNLNQLLDTGYWSSLIASPWTALLHLIDISIVVYLIYNFSKSIAGTKIMTLIRGVFLFIIVQIIASLFGLQTIAWLINQVITYGVIAAVVIFAPELRAMLEKLGRTTQIFGANTVSAEEKLIVAFLKSVAYMSPRKIGALVAVEQAQTLQEYRATGIPLNADISQELLINIFIPNTPLHDGAVIVKEDKVAVACAYLPLSESAGISKEFGTRHRAAIGLSEVSDAFVFIVSEETGSISIARNGIFKHDLTLDEFEAELRATFISENVEKKSIWKRLGGGKHER
ncbi:TPA: TIGR00159 family protein [Streptococcus suis]|uniref:diadenylate cyclase CdaA n=1 Tax=Streptococcus suis TaxID=1307 RepID=UPI0028A59406|nr:diadenylate cyclase CdaA [Streptococcus suis]WNN11617.1 diadenylate cyclase CdaA [Streptococcus suis]HEL1625598.1 TIGR00159 family protein [Streptococcus suis]HEL1702444.1 TIGR00159 family protein [Streptococcus suis]HEL1895351.1 TIGR00159 family protein [Streptococcus suis]HEL1952462.1 TIGR00159 family protein [Streptococcus suis]